MRRPLGAEKDRNAPADCVLIFKTLSGPSNRCPPPASSRDGQIFRTVGGVEWETVDEKKLKPGTILYVEKKDDQLQNED